MSQSMQRKTPGVYIQEMNAPLAIAQVETAIPAFIGYTEKSPALNTPTKINSLLEFEALFGRAKAENIEVTVNNVNGVYKVSAPNVSPKYCLYYQLQMFYANGGGDCYIVSAGTYGQRKTKLALLAGLKQTEEVDDITLIVFGDLPARGHHQLNRAVLAQAASLGDRFAILDIPDHPIDPIGEFRGKIGLTSLKYGAAYYPKLITTVLPNYTDQSVTLSFQGSPFDGQTMNRLKKGNALLFDDLKIKLAAAMRAHALILFPSAAIAGIYTATDLSRGVWKAPANVALQNVTAPQVQLTPEMQEALNVDVFSGKSINAIRSFAGKGVLVWGARTLAGNDNEWRYISVRRFFIQVEESIKKALTPFVFEPNDANTWVKAQNIIDNFLTSKWREGALAGAKAEDAFFVNIGLGKTMTAQDILEGRMIVEVGMAAVRPAEFIIIRQAYLMAGN